MVSMHNITPTILLDSCSADRFSASWRFKDQAYRKINIKIAILRKLLEPSNEYIRMASTFLRLIQEYEELILMPHLKISDNYCCPLCSDHQDHDFVWNELVESYVCLGCSHEINNGFDYPVQPTFDEYNCADTIERLLVLLGVSYEEAKRRYEELSKA